MTAPLLLAAFLLTPVGVSANSIYVADKCKDQHCNSLQHPIMDFADGKCVCRSHPCWDAAGKVHSCKDPKYPYLYYMWEKGAPICKCSALPHYDSEFIYKEKCPGQGCDTPEHPVLDIDEKGGCICRSHPCDNASGKKYECTDKAFPIRRYLTDKDGKGYCDCVARLEAPAQEEL
eukprot:CAMPEP_0178430864 /NCGR_PEP_ID=MMETSP0689_2-20121128/31541_1 /TAXON_ID=160604 /ORGANISM="Amphidinium massartii, Strain CS-259" /LENGTH=174 /DNA_ID=CAMNT_0020052737 /DNA_START=86 /DNA_END=610 /DNA_ORIENTATION=-